MRDYLFNINYKNLQIMKKLNETEILTFHSNHNANLKLEINKNEAKLFKRNSFFNSVTIHDNHCGCGLCTKPEGHKGYPNNIKDFEFGKVISAIDFIWWYDWKKRITKNNKHSSYGIKHIIERKLEYQRACKHNKVDSFRHLGNGELILAMMLLGFNIYNEHYNSPNVYFNVSENSLFQGHDANLFDKELNCFK